MIQLQLEGVEPAPEPIVGNVRHAAVLASVRFVNEHSAAELSIYTLRKAYERGFLEGVQHGKETQV